MKGLLLCTALGACFLGGPAAAKSNDTARAQGLIRERTGVTIPWSADGEAEGPVADTVRALLGRGLTEDRVVRVALLNNRRLRAALEEVGVSRAEFRQALLPANPTIEGEVRFNGGQRPGELGVMQDLSSILLVPLRRRAAGESLERTNLLAAHQALELVLETRSAFYEAQGAEQVRHYMERIVESARSAADLALRQHQAGNIPSLEADNRQTLYENAKIELSRSLTEVRAAREHLNRLMGVWGEETTWEILGDLPEVPADSIPTIGLEGLAVSNRLDLAAAEAEVRAIQGSFSLARFSRFPELRAGVHIEREPEGARTTGPAIELAFPLFDRGQHAVARTRSELRQARDRRAALAIEIRSDVRAALDLLISARELVAYYRDSVLPRRLRIVEQTQLEYNFMLTGVYQLLQVKEDEIKAQREYIEAQRDYWLARARLEHALGGPLPAAETD